MTLQNIKTNIYQRKNYKSKFRQKKLNLRPLDLQRAARNNSATDGTFLVLLTACYLYRPLGGGGTQRSAYMSVFSLSLARWREGLEERAFKVVAPRVEMSVRLSTGRGRSCARAYLVRLALSAQVCVEVTESTKVTNSLTAAAAFAKGARCSQTNKLQL